MEVAQVLVDTFIVVSRMFIALPGIDGEAPCRDTCTQRRLAERRIRDTVMSSKLNNNAWLRCGYKPMRERHVPPPRAHVGRAGCRPKQYIQLGGQQSFNG